MKCPASYLFLFSLCCCCCQKSTKQEKLSIPSKSVVQVESTLVIDTKVSVIKVKENGPNWNDSIFSIGDSHSIRIDFTDSSIQFYQMFNGQKKYISNKIKSHSSYVNFVLDDIDFDGKTEIISVSYHNMNGNTFCEVFDWNAGCDSIVRKVNYLLGGYCLNHKEQTIYEYYAGSWWMDVNERKSTWFGDELLVIQEISFGLLEKNMEADNVYCLEYHVRDSCDGKMKTVYNDDFDSTKYEKWSAQVRSGFDLTNVMW